MRPCTQKLPPAGRAGLALCAVLALVGPPVRAQRTAALDLTLGTPITFSASDQPLEVVADSSGKGFFVRRQHAENAFNVEHYGEKNRRDWGLPILFGDRSVGDAHVVSLPYRDHLITLAYLWAEDGGGLDVMRVAARKGTKGGKGLAATIGHIAPGPEHGRLDPRAITDATAHGRALTVHLLAAKNVVRAISTALYTAEPEALDADIVELPAPLADGKVSSTALRADGTGLIVLVGHDPAVKPAAGDHAKRMYLVQVAPGKAPVIVPVQPPGATPVCLACGWRPDGGIRCAGMALASDAPIPQLLSVDGASGPGDLAYRTEPLDPSLAEELFYTEEMMAQQQAKGRDKDAAKHRQAGITRFADRMQPIHFQAVAPDTFLFVGEVQERTATIDHQGMNPGKVENRSDHLCFFLVGPDGTCLRPAVLRKFIAEQGGGSGFIRTLVAYRHGLVHLFFNDNKQSAFQEGEPPPELAPGIYVSSPNVMKYADPMLHVEGPDGPVKRIPVLQGRTAKPVLIYGGMSTALNDREMLLFLSWNGTGSFTRVKLE
ncbi:MAG: hypothetical protein JST66_14335 [Bacteroidetes bacterium]|nr:hypothetical protein [Bacteroidota bacterium]